MQLAKLKFWDVYSYALTTEMFEAHLHSSEVLEQDTHGLKVVRLSDGNILKIFRIKSIFSIARIYSYARQFCRNASKLKALNIPTVTVVKLFHLIGTNKSAVQYQPLEGLTLRQVAQNQQFNDELLKKLGQFVATLHAKGVYFRSLHMGNIVLTPLGEFGLIDIADLRVHPKALGYYKCMRNFRHFFRVKSDIQTIDKNDWTIFVNAYISHSHLPSWAKARMQKYLNSEEVTQYFKV